MVPVSHAGLPLFPNNCSLLLPADLPNPLQSAKGSSMAPQPEWLRSLGDTADGAFVTDAKQRIITWNKGAERLLGYSASEVVNRHCYDVIAGRDRRAKVVCCPNCKVYRCLQRGILLPNFNSLTTTKDGQGIWVNFCTVALPYKDRRVLHLLRDVTRQDKDLDALQHIVATLRAYGVLPRRRERKMTGAHVDVLSLSASDPVLAGRGGQGFCTLRRKLGLSLADVAARSRGIAQKRQNRKYRISAMCLSQVENGSSLPSVYKLASLREIYKISWADLLCICGLLDVGRPVIPSR